MPRKKTNEEFIQEVRKLVGDEYTFLEPYRGKAVKIRVRHESCDHTYPVTPNSFLSGGNRCPYCTQNASKRESDFIHDVQEKHGNRYTVLDKYHNARTPIKVRCNVCGEIWTPFPNKLLEGTGCPICGAEQSTKKRTKRTDSFIVEYKQRVGDKYTFLEPYINKNTKIRVRHNTCETIYLVSPNNFFKGRRCPYCAGTTAGYVHWENILYTQETGWLDKKANKKDTKDS